MQKWKQKRSNMQCYDRQAKIYDVQYVEEQNAKIEDILKGTKFDLDELALDLGCGTGFLFPHIEKRMRFLVGIDVSKNMLKEAKKRTKNIQSIDLVQADADNIPFPDNTFGKIFAITLLQNMPDPTKTVTEMRRIGKQETIFAVTGLKKKFTQESFVDLLERAHLKVVTLNTDKKLKCIVAVCTTCEQKL